MLRNYGWMTLATLTIISVWGCTKPDQQSAPPSTTSPQDNARSTFNSTPANVAGLAGPAAAVYQFLDAVRTGNDDKAANMLSALAREKAAAWNRNVTPPASDTARFTIGKVEYLGEDGARVASTWTDLDEDGQLNSDNAIWVLRKEAQGWRIVGVAATVFPGEPPLLLNFEDPEEMAKKQQWVREEIRRRVEKENLQAKEPENSENIIR